MSSNDKTYVRLSLNYKYQNENPINLDSISNTNIFQSQTLDMMYKMIAKAISKKGPVGAKVTDYLNFYSLASKVRYEPGSRVNLTDKHVPSAAKTRR